MLSKPLATIALLAISALGELSGFSTVDRSFGAMIKRQGGYYPTTHLCGAGATCAEACGLGQITCPSSFGIFCYDPTIGDTCCPNLAGDSCSAGYYCSSDSIGTTYCCPDGMSLSDCGAAYSLTVALHSETGSVPIPTATDGASTTLETFSSSGLIHVSYPTASPSSSIAHGGVVTPTKNGTYSATATAPIQVTTNAAERVAYGGVGFGVAVGLAGAILGM